MKATVQSEVQVEYEYHEEMTAAHESPSEPAYCELLTVKLGGQAVDIDYMELWMRMELEQVCMEDWKARKEAAAASMKEERDEILRALREAREQLRAREET